MTAVGPFGGDGDSLGEGVGVGPRERQVALAVDRADAGGIVSEGGLVSLELVGGELVARPLGSPVSEQFRGPLDLVRTSRATALELLRLAAIAIAVQALFLSSSDSALRAVLSALPVAAVWVLGQRAGSRFVPRALGRVAPLVVGTAIGALVVSALVVWVPALQLDLSLFALMAAVVLALSVCFEILSERVAGPARVLVVGADPNAAQLAEDVGSDPEQRFDVVAVASESAEALPGVPTTCAMDDLVPTLMRERPDLVVLALERGRPHVFRQLLDVADTGFRVVGLPEFYEHAFGRVPVRHLSAAWFMSVLHLYQPAYSRFAKRSFDVAVVLLALLVTAPLLAAIALVISLSGGSIIYRQRRLGENGRVFTMFKFRTMREDAERPGEAVWAATRDSRVTGVGRVLRQMRLDELPQLWNVLRGDMSIVGPRPERPEFLRRLNEEVPFWSRRHLLKPGITGWAQVHSGYASGSAETETKLSYDLWYLRHRSFFVDLAICAKTTWTLLSGSGAR